MKLEATPAMKRAFEDYSKKGVITSDAYHYALMSGYSEETLEKLRAGVEARVRESRASLALQSDPLRYKPRPKPSNPSDPTLEWRAKMGKQVTSELVGRGEVTAQRRYHLRTIPEQYRSMLSEVQRCALERFVADSVMILRVKISDLNTSGGGTPGRLGGLGNAPDFKRRALDRHTWIVRFLSSEARMVAKCLLTDEVARNDGGPLSLEEFSQRVMGSRISHSREKWGFSLGALWLLAAQLVHCYAICPVGAEPVSKNEKKFLENSAT